MLASASGSARSTARRSSPAGKRLLALGLARFRHARPCGHERQQVADVNDAFGIVEGLVVDHEARMRRAFEQAHQFAERDVALDRDDVGAMDHDVGDAPLVQAEDVAQHGALDRGKADIVRASRHRARPADRRAPIPASSRTGCGSRAAASSRRRGAATSPCCTTAGRLRVLRGLSWVGSESAISVHPLAGRSA